MPKFEDITGQRFGRLVVTGCNSSKRGGGTWICLCDCGRNKIVDANSLKSGHTQSCGCLRHGLCFTPTWWSWVGMTARCRNQNRKAYGGRGISVCDRWLKFENFLSDMGERPLGHTIDRINNDGDYEPGNCRWATAKQQSENKRKNTWWRQRKRDSSGRFSGF